MALNVNEDAMMALNVELRSDNDSERRNLKVMMVTLNVKLKNDNSFGSLIKKLTLNTKLEE